MLTTAAARRPATLEQLAATVLVPLDSPSMPTPCSVVIGAPIGAPRPPPPVCSRRSPSSPAGRSPDGDGPASRAPRGIERAAAGRTETLAVVDPRNGHLELEAPAIRAQPRRERRGRPDVVQTAASSTTRRSGAAPTRQTGIQFRCRSPSPGPVDGPTTGRRVQHRPADVSETPCGSSTTSDRTVVGRSTRVDVLGSSGASGRSFYFDALGLRFRRATEVTVGDARSRVREGAVKWQLQGSTRGRCRARVLWPSTCGGVLVTTIQRE